MKEKKGQDGQRYFVARLAPSSLSFICRHVLQNKKTKLDNISIYRYYSDVLLKVEGLYDSGFLDERGL